MQLVNWTSFSMLSVYMCRQAMCVHMHRHAICVYTCRHAICPAIIQEGDWVLGLEEPASTVSISVQNKHTYLVLTPEPADSFWEGQTLMPCLRLGFFLIHRGKASLTTTDAFLRCSHCSRRYANNIVLALSKVARKQYTHLLSQPETLFALVHGIESQQ